MRRLLALSAIGLLVLVAGGAAADTFAVHLVSQTSTTITLGWDPQPGYGYLFSANGVLVSRTNDPSRDNVKFSKVTPASYDIDVIVKGANGHYPIEVTPPPPGAKITQTIASGSTITSLSGWRAVYDANNDGVEDDPGTVEFLVDGVRLLTEENPPFGDSFIDGTYTVLNGVHTFKVRALSGTTVLAENSVVATVETVITPPPPSGFPNATNTGVPAGTTLTAYTGPSTITTPNTVIDSKSMGCIDIEASGVIIRNSRIAGQCFFVVDVHGGSTSVTITDTEIDCQNNPNSGVVGDDVVLLRVDIHGCENAGSIDGDWDIRDSYIHGLYINNPATHADGLQTFAGISNVQIVHNTILAFRETNPSSGCCAVSAIIADEVGAPKVNWLIANNKLAGGGFTVYCATGTPVNWVIRDNAFSNVPMPPAFGFSRNCGNPAIVQSGNYVLETGQPLYLP